MEKASTPNKKRLIDELTKGRDSTKMLQNLLQRRVVDVSTKDLVMNIVGSFSNSILELSSCGSEVLCPAPETTYVSSTCSAEPTWELGKRDVKPMPAVVKNRRGCYKRRKKEDSTVKIVDTIEDEFAWRKYGQKEVLDSKFPRCYFRCKHKNEGCKALKQVQKLEDGSQMFHVTYFGFHTCQKRPKNTQMFSDSKALSFFLVNFEDSKINHSSIGPPSITHANINPSFEQEDDSNSQIDDCPASGYHGKLELSHDNVFKGVAFIDDFNFD